LRLPFQNYNGTIEEHAMILYFLRHGIAADREDWSRPDKERPLTDKGRQRMQRQAKVMAKALDLDLILTSPYVRAYQTAEIVAKQMEKKDSLKVDDRLAPGFDAQKLSEILDQYPDKQVIMLVGHEPDFSSVVSQLIGWGRVIFKKGTLAEVILTDRENLQGELRELSSPRLMRG
jgi:phosphohistidine phosphatase